MVVVMRVGGCLAERFQATTTTSTITSSEVVMLVMLMVGGSGITHLSVSRVHT